MSTYGYRKVGGRKIPLPPFYGGYVQPMPPEKVYHERTSLCLGCPYPRHGMMCWNDKNEECLRADMQELEEIFVSGDDGVVLELKSEPKPGDESE